MIFIGFNRIRTTEKNRFIYYIICLYEFICWSERPYDS